jgi:hypothetical protein
MIVFILFFILPLIIVKVESAEITMPNSWYNGLNMNMNISETSISMFLGESSGDRSGYSVSAAGDVNGDGFDDILIGAPERNVGGSFIGETYLFFGKASGWVLGMSISSADASFIGNNYSYSGSSVSGVGDVNGDGFDDILIGAPTKEMSYLVFGKATGWSKDYSLSFADASFVGETAEDWFGSSVSGAGDVNGDGYDDILIGAPDRDQGASNVGKIYLILGKASGWSKDTPMTMADASFIGEARNDHAGYSISSAGDVNGDGYDDILIGAYGSRDNGQTYLIFGKIDGWSRDISLSSADASFIGKSYGEDSGYSVSGAGDVNNDGFDDILIGAPLGSEDFSGHSYLIFGKASGWSMDTSLSSADASFLGESSEDCSGHSVSGAGDVNKDGFDDILIGAPWRSEGVSNSGKTYLILGKVSGWTKDMSLSNADYSFKGEAAGDRSGYSVSGAGDIDNDGLDDILIGAPYRREGGAESGKTYLVSGAGYSEPLQVFDISVRNGVGDMVSRADINDILYVEMIGKDRNVTQIDRVRINISFSKSFPAQITTSLLETGKNTGIYKGVFIVPLRAEYIEIMRFSAYIDLNNYYNVMVDYLSRPSSVNSMGIYHTPTSTLKISILDIGQTAYIRCTGADSNPAKTDKAFVNLSSDKNTGFRPLIVLSETGESTGVFVITFTVPDNMEYFENITLTSVESPSITARFMVQTTVEIRIDDPYLDAIEDEGYCVSFTNIGYNPGRWTLTTNADWLKWNDTKNEIFGIPRNNDVGVDLWDVLLSLEDSFGNRDSINYTLSVFNTPPHIITEPKRECYEKEEYLLNMDSDDDGQGNISWSLMTSSSFLTIDRKTGNLSGTPMEGDEGVYLVNVQVQDGNGGSDNLIFNLTVVGRNDRPQIITSDITQIEQDTPFKRDYDVFDPDEGDTHIWSLRTDAEWLAMENDTGVLWGTPDGYDVGDWLVNITVTDQGGLSDYREFTLKVLDLKDKPRFVDVPTDTELLHGINYYFDVNVSDPDLNDRVTYSVRTEPASSMVIDPNTGDLRWKANYRSMPSTGKGMKVTLTASDGQLFSTYEFYIKVTPTQSPSSELVSPGKGARSRSAYTLLEWSGTDPENEPLTYVLYLADSEVNVAAKRSEDIVSNDIEDNYYNMTGLVQGKTYYWTVIPDDGCTYGKCLNGVFSFRVNNKPTVRSVEDQSAQAGKEFMVKVTGTDLDQDDTLTYRISSGPSGMTIRDSGMIVWTPKESQVGVHTVRVIVSDGYEETVLSFRIEVSEGEGSGIGLIIGVVVGILVLVIIGLLFYILVLRGKGEEEKKDEVDEEARKMMEEMEQKKKEKEWEESHIRPSEQQTVASVPLSAEEAHAQDKGGKPKSYEDLYGRPAPDRTEEITTDELKDELGKLVEELKNVEVSVEKDK